MIRFSLRCDREHQFDSWFGSSADFDRLTGASMVSCAICGSTEVQKDMMAPGVASGAAQEPEPSLSAPASPAEQALSELRRKIEANSENVGTGFAAEARRIHDGDAEMRSIYGQARIADAKALVDEGIAIAPLPWSSRKVS